MRTRTYTVSLKRWFPADGLIAIAVAKLCVLREDYFLELQGFIIPGPGHFEGTSSGGGVPELDDNSASWRRLYFFRNSMRTLNEIRNLAERMHTNRIDKDALSKEPEPIVEGFKTLKEKLSRTTDLVKDLRDSLGVHVLHSDIQKVLKDMDSGMTGFFQDGEIRGKTRYRFASELTCSKS
jgi:hypothetical protein